MEDSKITVNTGQQLNGAIFIADLQGTILDVNDQFEMMMEMKKEKIISMNYKKFILSEEIDHQVLLKKNNIVLKKAQIRMANGLIKEMNFYLSLLINNNEKLIIGVLNQTSKPQIKHILIVTDEAILSDTLARLLSPYHEVLCAKYTEQVYEIVNQHKNKIDVIFCDLSIASQHAIDFFYLIAQKHRGLEQRIIFITGGGDFMRARDFLSKINNLCVAHPFTREDLLHVIEIL